MELDHDFTVATDADTAWPVLLDVERMHPLIPGAVYESGADGEHHGRLRIKFGPTTVTYRGTVRIAVVDDLTRTAILEITAREARGQGTVSGSLQATVLPAASSARVVLHTKLAFAGGRAASLSEHLVHDTGAKLLTRLSTNLNALLTSPARTELVTTEPVTVDVEELIPLEAPAPAPVETTPTEPPAAMETGPLTIDTTPAEPVTVDAEELVPVGAPETAPVEAEPLIVETASAEAVSVEEGAAEAEKAESVGGRGGRVESGEDDRPELESYELSERTGWLRRVLPVFGVLVVVLVVRRLLRRR